VENDYSNVAGGSTLDDLLQALEDYLPVLLGLVKDGNLDTGSNKL